MSIWGKLAGAAAGLAIGGPIGALLGGVAGHYVIDRDKEQDGPAENQVAFTVGVIACLLYTSPSPRDRQKSRMPSSA